MKKIQKISHANKIKVFIFIILIGLYTPVFAIGNKPKIISIVGSTVHETKYQYIAFSKLPAYFSPNKYSLRSLTNTFSSSFKKLPSLANFELLPVYGYALTGFDFNHTSAQELK